MILAPGVKPTVRERALKAFRQQGATAALVDDIDLCRLVYPAQDQRPNQILALPSSSSSSSASPSRRSTAATTGRTCSLEMSVGRRDEARELAQSNRAQRLFSGRKLGKSALLKFVQGTEDGKTLPSGNTLRVVYVSAAGKHSEHDSLSTTS